MGRPQRPIDPHNSPLEAFAWELRLLRAKTGNPTYREMAQRCGFSASALSAAAAGLTTPSRQVTLAYVAACGGDAAQWADRWAALHTSLALKALSAAGPRPTHRDDAPRAPSNTDTRILEQPTAARNSIGVVASGVALVVVSDVLTERLGPLSTCVVAAVATAAGAATLRARR